ncbi:MAG: DUF2341 domain-containing protein [Candidatus Aenigmatarchaeota archaeon]
MTIQTYQHGQTFAEGDIVIDNLFVTNSSPAGPTWTYGSNCKYGNCLSFDGGDDFVNLTNSSDLRINGSGLTLEAWVYPNDNTEVAVIHKGNHYSMYINGSGNLSYADSITWSYDTIGGYGYVPTGQWSHLAITFDGANINFYIDGNNVGTKERAGSLSNDGSLPVLGCYAGSSGGTTCTNSPFNGTMDNVRVWNRSLSATEINSSRDSLHPPSRDGLVAWWSMDEPSGDVIQDYHWIVDGNYGAGGSFDGTNDYLQTADSSELRPSSAFTVMSWIKPIAETTLADYRTIISKEENSTYKNYWLGLWDNSADGYCNDGVAALRFTVSQVNVTACGTTDLASSSAWHHVAAVYNGSGVALYVDGSLENSTADSGAADTQTGEALFIGVENGSAKTGYFNGSVDDVRIYSKALTADEINQTMNMTFYVQSISTNFGAWTAYAAMNNSAMKTTIISKAFNINDQTPLYRAVMTNESNSTVDFGATVNMTAEVYDDADDGYAWLETNESGSWANQTCGASCYGSTMYLTIMTSWAPANFTWHNTSVSAGTDLGWRIWINDTFNQMNVTSIQTLVIRDYNPPNTTNTQQNSSNPGILAGVNLSTDAYDEYNIEYALLETNESGSWANKTITAIGTDNITVYYEWGNTSCYPGQTIQWRIWLNDSFGQYNVTDTMAFNLNISEVFEYITGDRIYSSAAIADIDSDGVMDILIGSDDDKVYAFNGTTGVSKWNFTTGDNIGSSPALANVRGDSDLEIIVGSLDNKVYIINSTGDEVWNYSTDNMIWSSPAVIDINGDDYKEVLIGSADGKLYTFTVAPEVSGWWNSNWGTRKELTFSGWSGGGTGDLADFPVLVVLNSSRIDYSKTKDDGSDLRFVDSDNTTELKYHIEKWNESGDSYVWVKVPGLNNTATDYIWMYYNSPGAADVQNESGTYDDSYTGIWHMNETSGNHTDSTSNNNDASVTSAYKQGNATGKVGDSSGFDGTGDNVETTDQSYFSAVNNDITVSAWINTDKNNIWNNFLSKAAVSNYEWLFRVNTGNNVTFAMWSLAGSGDKTVASVGTLDVGVWYHVAAAFGDGFEPTIYINGVNDTYTLSNIDRTLEDGTAKFKIGQYLTATFNGTIDEVRVSKTLRSDEWIKASYMTSSDSVITYKTAENGGISLIWNYTTGGIVWSSPIIADLDGDSSYDILIGSYDNKLYALNKTGDSMWNFTADDDIESVPAVIDFGYAYKQVVFGSYDNKLYCIWANNGSQVWSYTGDDWFIASPNYGDIDGDSQYEIVAASDDGILYAFNHDGSSLWNYTIPSGGRVESSPSLADMDGDGIWDVVVGSSDNYVYCLKGTNGNFLWKYHVGGYVYSSPTLENVLGYGRMDIVIGTFGYKIKLLDPTWDRFGGNAGRTRVLDDSSPVCLSRNSTTTWIAANQNVTISTLWKDPHTNLDGAWFWDNSTGSFDLRNSTNLIGLSSWFNNTINVSILAENITQSTVYYKVNATDTPGNVGEITGYVNTKECDADSDCHVLYDIYYQCTSYQCVYVPPSFLGPPKTNEIESIAGAGQTPTTIPPVTNEQKIKETKKIAEVRAMETVRTTFYNAELGISAVKLKTNIDAKNVVVIIEKVTVATPLPMAYMYLNMTVDGLANDDIESAELEFSVDKEWLAENNMTAGDIVLMRYNQEWQELPTNIIKQDENYAYYNAETPGFSLFVIAARKASAICGDGICEENDCQEDCLPTEEPEITIEPEAPPSLTVFMLIISMILVSAYMIFHVERTRSTTKPAKKRRLNIRIVPAVATFIVMTLLYIVLSQGNVTLPGAVSTSDGLFVSPKETPQPPSGVTGGITAMVTGEQKTDFIGVNMKTNPYGFAIADNWSLELSDEMVRASVSWYTDVGAGAGDIYIGYSTDGQNWEEQGPFSESGSIQQTFFDLSGIEDLDNLRLRFRGQDLDRMYPAFAYVSFKVESY